jgi:hypothetical protein
MKKRSNKGEINMIESMEIKAYNKGHLTDKIDKLNRKAIKINCPTMTLTFGEDIVRTWTDEMGRKRVKVTVEATLDYEMPIIDGWKLISTFDIYTATKKIPGSEEMGILQNIVTTSTVPGETVPYKYLNKTEIHCDHCGHNRYRTHSMLMLNIRSGQYKEVGSTCIRDFFGHDPVAFMRWASWSFTDLIGSLPEEEGLGGSKRGPEDLRETLIFTSATIRMYGWMSKGKAYQEGKEWFTAEEVANQMSPFVTMKEADRVKVDDRDREAADATIKYFAGEADNTNDYMANCHKMTLLGYVPYKHWGLTVSMLPSAQRALAEAKAAADDTSEYVGTIGDKLKGIEAECVFAKDLHSDWGVKTLYIFKGTDGNAYKTFYTGDKWGAYEGDTVLLNGTVKAHDEYKGKKSTLLTRCFAKVTKDGAPEAIEARK